MSRHIFLSPHLDDVTLSCGGTLARLVGDGAQVSVINIFAGSPAADDPISDFAHYQHTMWGNPQAAYQTRRAEDAAAMACFGLEPVWFDFLDCIYRGQPQAGIWYYTSDPDIFGQVHPAEFDTALAIAAAVAELIEQGPSDDIELPVLYAPLTVGHHVDHQLTFLAALQWHRRGYPICFYEDYPYADREPFYVPEALEITTPTLLRQAGYLPENGGADLWQSEIFPFSPEALQLKIKAIAAYTTQLEVLFGGVTAMARRVTAYADHIGQTSPAERFWRLQLDPHG